MKNPTVYYYILLFIVLYHTLQDCSILNYTVLNYTILYYTIQYNTLKRSIKIAQAKNKKKYYVKFLHIMILIVLLSAEIDYSCLIEHQLLIFVDNGN